MENRKMKLLFLTNVPSPYRVDFFNAVGQQCELTVLYPKESSSERDRKWTAEAAKTFRQVYLKGSSTAVDKAFCPGVIRWLHSGWDAIVICGNTSPTEMLAIEWCRLRRLPYCIEADGAFAKSGRGLKERLKTHFIGGAGLYLSTCQQLDQYFCRYGADGERIVRYHFSSLRASDILAEPVTEAEKTALRQQLDIREKQMLLSVGQFIPRKGFDVLLEAVNGMDKNIGIYIVGGKPTEEYLRYARENDLTNVHFVGFQTRDELKTYYMAADAFVLPTREDIWGLVVNEAMAYGLPVVTTDRCNAGLELLTSGENGYVVPVEDSHALAGAIAAMLENSRALGANALETIRAYTVEAMAGDHITLLERFCSGRASVE